MDIFQEAAKPYNNVLKNNGHKKELKYANKGTIQNKRGETPNDSDPKKSEPLTNNTKENNEKRRRKITWFNPPFSRNVATNIGKIFFTLLSACFPANNKLQKIINKNTIKLSCSCMSSIKTKYRQPKQSNPKQREDQGGANKAMQLQKQDIVFTARQLSPKRSRLPDHRHTDQHNEGRHLYRNNRERVQNTI